MQTHVAADDSPATQGKLVLWTGTARGVPINKTATRLLHWTLPQAGCRGPRAGSGPTQTCMMYVSEVVSLEHSWKQGPPRPGGVTVTGLAQRHGTSRLALGIAAREGGAEAVCMYSRALWPDQLPRPGSPGAGDDATRKHGECSLLSWALTVGAFDGLLLTSGNEQNEDMSSSVSGSRGCVTSIGSGSQLPDWLAGAVAGAQRGVCTSHVPWGAAGA